MMTELQKLTVDELDVYNRDRIFFENIVTV